MPIAVALVSTGCVHEHVTVDAPACERCLIRLRRGAMRCSACRRTGCLHCPVSLITEKMIFGHAVPEAQDQKIAKMQASRTTLK